MAEILVLEFDGIDDSGYKNVNANLGIDPSTGSGDWPAGMQSHLAGTTDDGTFVVVEVWDSREAQADFMQNRLLAALQGAGITAQPKVKWAHLFGQH